MAKINPLLAREIKDLAKALPESQYTTRETDRIKGSELLLTGVKEVDGEPVKPEEYYTMKNPVLHEVNHERRLRKAYTKYGLEGIRQYIKRFIKPGKEALLKEILHQLDMMRSLKHKDARTLDRSQKTISNEQRRPAMAH